MPDRVEVQDLSCPASIPPASPLKIALTGVFACDVQRLTIRIPAGHSGLTGIAFGYGNNPILPRSAGAYISGDDEVIIYDMSHYIDGPQWQAFVCNQDTQSHVWEVRFEVNEIRAYGTVSPSAPLDPADIHAAGSALIGVGG